MSRASGHPAGGFRAEDRWRRFAALLLCAAAAGFAGLVAFVAAADPYDTGRFALFGPRPRQAISPLLAAASLGRDPRFDAVIVGNSHIAPVSPTRLTEATGVPFLALTAAGGTAEPIVALLRWFLAHRERPARAIVVGLDDLWCTHDLRVPRGSPYPTWLVSLNPIRYLGNLARLDSLQQALDRFFKPGRRHPRPVPPDGYWDIALDLTWEEAQVRQRLGPLVWTATNPTGRYPALELLGSALAVPAVTGETVLVLLIPPVWAGGLPPRTSVSFANHEACKAAIRRFAEARPRSVVLDWRVDTPATRDPRHFFDPSHYRSPVPEMIEAEIAATLRDPKAGTRREAE